MREVMITTDDNPFDPFTQFDEWYTEDMTRGYNTCGILAAISSTSPALSEQTNTDLVEFAMDEMIRLFPEVIGFNGVHYKKIERNV